MPWRNKLVHLPLENSSAPSLTFASKAWAYLSKLVPNPNGRILALLRTVHKLPTEANIYTSLHILVIMPRPTNTTAKSFIVFVT